MRTEKPKKRTINHGTIRVDESEMLFAAFNIHEVHIRVAEAHFSCYNQVSKKRVDNSKRMEAGQVRVANLKKNGCILWQQQKFWKQKKNKDNGE
jgi:hypothetical protein